MNFAAQTISFPTVRTVLNFQSCFFYPGTSVHFRFSFAHIFNGIVAITLLSITARRVFRKRFQQRYGACGIREIRRSDIQYPCTIFARQTTAPCGRYRRYYLCRCRREFPPRTFIAPETANKTMKENETASK